MEIKLPKNVKFIIDTLEAAGYEAYAVGGCVRDSLLNRKPNDWDITTSAKPLETKALFKRTFDTGIQHGTVSILLDKEIFEVTTYRVDGEYEDARHPKEVTFTAELKEDLLRRDFTINAMAYNETKGLIDLYGGVEDLNKGIIRCVGNAHDRLTEDALRILRAIRFAAQLNYRIDAETEAAIVDLAPNLSKISAERIQTELVKLLTSDHPEFIREAYRLGITRVILPEFDSMMECKQNNPNHCYTVGEHSIMVMENLPPDKVMRLTGLLHDVAKPVTKTTDESGIDHFHNHPLVGYEMSRKILKRLKFDNDTIDKVSTLVKYHDREIRMEESPVAVRRAMNEIGKEYFPAVFEFGRADVMGQSDFRRVVKLDHIDALMKLYRKIIKDKECVCLKELSVTGSDLIKEGFKPGPGLGKILSELLKVVIEDPHKNDKDYLLKLAKKIEV